MPRKTLAEKMSSPAEPEIVLMNRPVMGFQVGDKMLIPTPRQIEAYVNRIPKGETRTTIEMREALAKEVGADVSCPLTSGIFLRIVCEASLDPTMDVDAPFWRVVDPKGPLAKKLACGPDWIQSMRESEA